MEQPFVNEIEVLPNWLMHHLADPEETLGHIARAYRDFALEGRAADAPPADSSTAKEGETTSGGAATCADE